RKLGAYCIPLLVGKTKRFHRGPPQCHAHVASSCRVSWENTGNARESGEATCAQHGRPRRTRGSKKAQHLPGCLMVQLVGLEPTTFGSTIRRSSQLSYSCMPFEQGGN